jgi:hypothetical protein
MRLPESRLGDRPESGVVELPRVGTTLRRKTCDGAYTKSAIVSGTVTPAERTATSRFGPLLQKLGFERIIDRVQAAGVGTLRSVERLQ